MTKPASPPPAGISPEAQAFLRDTPLPLPREITAKTISAVRAANAMAYRPAAEALGAAYLERVEEEEIAGVRVQVCRPETADPALEDQALLYFFGGGHVVGGPVEDQVITAPLAHRLARTVYVPYYRLAPEHPFPAALDDATAVYRGLLERFAPKDLAVSGESAGGNLALATLLRARDEGRPLPAAAALLSPWADLTLSSESHRVNKGLDPTFTDDPGHSNLAAEAAAYGGGRDLSDPLISPLHAEDWHGFPPTLITSGTRDLLLGDCVRLSTAMRRDGVDLRFHVWEGMWHVFEYYPEIPEARQSLEEVAAFLDAQLGRT